MLYKFLEGSRGSRGFKKAQEGSRWLKRVQEEGSGGFKNGSIGFKKVQDVSRGFKSDIEGSRRARKNAFCLWLKDKEI